MVVEEITSVKCHAGSASSEAFEQNFSLTDIGHDGNLWRNQDDHDPVWPSDPIAAHSDVVPAFNLEGGG